MPELRVIAPGRVYRVDSDANPFADVPSDRRPVGRRVGELCRPEGVVADFLRNFFESDDLQVRFRPSFSRSLEPSAEIDVAFMSGALKGRWLGDRRLRNDASQRVALRRHRSRALHRLAFGMGPDRLTMLRYGVNDLRLFFEGDLRFLGQFR